MIVAIIGHRNASSPNYHLVVVGSLCSLFFANLHVLLSRTLIALCVLFDLPDGGVLVLIAITNSLVYHHHPLNALCGAPHLVQANYQATLVCDYKVSLAGHVRHRHATTQ